MDNTESTPFGGPFTALDFKVQFCIFRHELVRVSRDFFYEESPIGTIPPSFPDYLLTNLLWLKRPLYAPNLPRKRIIADYYAATQPNNRIWKSYTNEIEKLQESQKISSDDYYLLRYAIEAKSALMDLTLGEEEIFSLGTINEILKLARERIKQEREDELHGKINTEIQKRREAEVSLSSVMAREMNRNTRIASMARRTSFTFVLAIKFLAFALLLIGTISTFPWNLPVFKIQPFSYIISILQFILLILSVGNLMFGTTLITYFNTLEVWLAIKVKDSLDRVFG